MLDKLRGRASSWITKILFTLIILSFIFFFGYSRMQKGGAVSSVAAKVNGEAIPYGMYKIAFENVREFYKQLFPDGVPDEMSPQLRAGALYQVINQTLLTQLAKELGIAVTVNEVFDIISNDPNFQKDGLFDPYSYKHVFLPFFERKYGLNYEEFVKHEILANKARKFITDQVIVSEPEVKEAFDKSKMFWSFKRIKIQDTPAEGVKYDAGAEEIASNVLDTAKSSDKKLSRLVKKYKLEEEKLADITIDKKHQLMPSIGENEQFNLLFSLTPENPLHEKPIKSGAAWYVFKLVDFKKPAEKDWEKEKDDFVAKYTERKQQERLREVQETLKEKAKIEDYVLNTGQ